MLTIAVCGIGEGSGDEVVDVKVGSGVADEAATAGGGGSLNIQKDKATTKTIKAARNARINH